MIDLQIEEYCKRCNAFKVEQKSNAFEEVDIYDRVHRTETVHTLSCVHREKCKAIKKHLEREKENGRT